MQHGSTQQCRPAVRGFLAIKVLSCREMNAGQSVAPGHKKTEMPYHGAGIDMAELRSETGLEELRPETGMEELRSWIDMAELCTETGKEELRSGKARRGCTT